MKFLEKDIWSDDVPTLPRKKDLGSLLFDFPSKISTNRTFPQPVSTPPPMNRSAELAQFGFRGIRNTHRARASSMPAARPDTSARLYVPE